MHSWKHSLPTTKPFYAVKCNPNPALLAVVASLGANFDCASQAEIETILGLGVSPDRILYANPCKAVSHIKYAANVGVNLTTFEEDSKIQEQIFVYSITITIHYTSIKITYSIYNLIHST
ncbi:hypothetical protein ACSBR2_001619 [Camellia fascicularis]